MKKKYMKIYEKNKINRSLLKKRNQKICFYTLANASFIFLKDFAWTTLKK